MTAILGGALAIVLGAWLIRWIFRLPPTSSPNVAASVIVSGIFYLLLSGFGTGQGGFEARLGHMLAFPTAGLTLIAGGIAFGVTLVYYALRGPLR